MQTNNFGGDSPFIVILGPKTRLAKEVLSLEVLEREKFRLIARDHAEQDELSALYNDLKCFPGWELEWNWPGDYKRLIIFCCAAGPIHPNSINWDSDVSTSSRDLSLIQKIVKDHHHIPVHIVFVSSVLALSPKVDRSAYAGWKCLMEAAMQAMADQEPGVHLSVLYPGRLIERTRLSKPTSFLHTRYSRMARILVRISQRSVPQRTVVGLDARIWLLIRGFVRCKSIITSKI